MLGAKEALHGNGTSAAEYQGECVACKVQCLILDELILNELIFNELILDEMIIHASLFDESARRNCEGKSSVLGLRLVYCDQIAREKREGGGALSPFPP